MHTCNSCNGCGYQEFYEDDRLVMDACYRCGASGLISDEMLRDNKLSAVAATLASWQVMEMEDYANSDPEGEDWTFRAAESMMSPRDYSDSLFYRYYDSYVDTLVGMSKEDQDLLLAWNETKPIRRQKRIPQMEHRSYLVDPPPMEDDGIPF